MTTTHFASEAMPENPGPALVMVIGAKNVVSFGASKGIVPMVQKYDYLTAYMIVSTFTNSIHRFRLIPPAFWCVYRHLPPGHPNVFPES